MSDQQRQDGRRYQPRFAGEAFAHMDNPKDGPMLRKLASTVAWKNPPQSTVRAEVSR
jgi:hypothetical protein